MIHIESAGITDVGRKREGNEDAYFLDDKHQLYVVADGMGGHMAGEVASGLVVDTFRSFLENGEGEEVPEIDETLSPEGNRLLTWIQAANQTVYQKSREDKECRGMGSTVAAVCCTDSTLIAANVGDSPVYLVRNGEIEPLSVTHTVETEQAAIDPERVKLFDKKILEMLSRAIGVGEEVEADACETPCYKGDVVILCSDGLSNKVSPEEMVEIVNQNPPEMSCQLFVNLANERGGDDNITVIVLEVKKIELEKGPLLRFFFRLTGQIWTFLNNL